MQVAGNCCMQNQLWCFLRCGFRHPWFFQCESGLNLAPQIRLRLLLIEGPDTDPTYYLGLSVQFTFVTSKMAKDCNI